MIRCPCCSKPTTPAKAIPVPRSWLRYGDRVCVDCDWTIRREFLYVVDEDGAAWPPCPTHPQKERSPT